MAGRRSGVPKGRSSVTADVRDDRVVRLSKTNMSLNCVATVVEAVGRVSTASDIAVQAGPVRMVRAIYAPAAQLGTAAPTTATLPIPLS